MAKLIAAIFALPIALVALFKLLDIRSDRPDMSPETIPETIPTAPKTEKSQTT